MGLASFPLDRKLSRIVLPTAVVASAALALWLARGSVFTTDELYWLPLSTGSLGSMLHPYGGHLIVLPLLAFKGANAVFGAHDGIFRAGTVLETGALAVLVFIYAERRIGSLPALAPALIILFFGSAWQVLLGALTGMQTISALLFGLGALLALERQDRAGDIAACVLLCLSLASFSDGIAFLAGAAVGIALGPEPRRRAWVVAVPFVAYAAWRLWALHFGGTRADLTNILWLPAYGVDSLSVVATSLFGRGGAVEGTQLTYLKLSGFSFDRLTGGLVIVAFEALAVGLAVRAMRKRGPTPPTFWVIIAVLAAFWVLQSLVLNPVGRPGEMRYVWRGGVVLLLVAVEMARGIRLGGLATATLLALTAVAILGNIPRFEEGRAYLAAQAGDTGPLVRGLTGDGVYTNGDKVLAKVVRLRLLRTHARGSPCARAEAAGPGVAVGQNRTVILRAAGPTDVRAQRFLSGYSIDLGRLRAFRAARLTTPIDPSPIPWRLRPASGSMLVCSA